MATVVYTPVCLLLEIYGGFNLLLRFITPLSDEIHIIKNTFGIILRDISSE